MELIPYGRQHLIQKDFDAITETLRGNWLTCGPAVEKFEQSIAEYCGARHVVAVSNGTAALHVALLAAGLKSGDRVVTSPNTFLASANCAEYVGATADFSDIDPASCNIDPKSLEQNWKPDTRAVIPVDFAGRPCDMQQISRIARERGALVLEDAAHAIGSEVVVDGKTYKVGGIPGRI